jgi:malate dehydrogenase (oxaloacetate-decarboxylating)(NADP+)
MRKQMKRSEALNYHEFPIPGKIKVVPTKKYTTQRDLTLAYSPGVAEPCLEIEKEIKNAYKYTNKGNLVAVISNGTAVLGLGNIGPEASKPVMEGKALLFKIFADIDVFDIEICTQEKELFIETVKQIAPTFGGINLEDVKAPEAFEIEERLKNELDIPVMHDDQHGTAIISAAALLNALEIAGKKIDKVSIVVNGAGASAISCARFYKTLGVRSENIVMIDSKGVIRKNREHLTKEKSEFVTERNIYSLEEAIIDADVFLGLSVGNVLTTEMILSMANDPIVFALANPDPEIKYELAIKTRKDIIMATGRSDHPNQVNNVLGFPFIFRGALDVRATKINEKMKMAATIALADLAKEPVPEQVNIAYGETKLNFGREYLIPKPFDPRLIVKIPIAVAKAAVESGVAKERIDDWDKYEDRLFDRLGHDHKLVRFIANRAKLNPKRIVFAEADHLDVLKAAQIVQEEGIGIPILLGNKEIILSLMNQIGFHDEVELIDPQCEEHKSLVEKYAKKFWKKRHRKGVTLYLAKKYMTERNYFAAMMVELGEADAMISGYSRAYPNVLKPVLEVIGKFEGVKKVATTNLMMTKRGPLFISDTSINIKPTAKELANIAQMTNYTMKMFGLKPVIAMISFSNFGSSNQPEAVVVSDAVKMLHRLSPDTIVDGEMQADFALNSKMLNDKFPFSRLSGKKVNALIFSNLESANSIYKLIKELNNADSIGPIMLGMKKPVHILQLRASVEEIVNMAAVSVIDAQQKEKNKIKSLVFDEIHV